MYTAEEFDINKTKVLKYVLYKKRTEFEIRRKFSKDMEENLLDDVIEELKENGYISDNNYIERAVNEYMAINTLSLKEIKYKLLSKGINNNIIEQYVDNHIEELKKYESECAKKIIYKKSGLEKEEIRAYLFKKGYSDESIRQAFDEI